MVKEPTGVVAGQPAVPEKGSQHRQQNHCRHGNTDEGQPPQPEGGQGHLPDPPGPVEHHVPEHRVENGEKHQLIEEVEVAHRREEHGKDVQPRFLPVEHPLRPQQQQGEVDQRVEKKGMAHPGVEGEAAEHIAEGGAEGPRPPLVKAEAEAGKKEPCQIQTYRHQGGKHVFGRRHGREK